MDITPYKVIYWDGDTLSHAEVRPCCKEDNVVDYAIYINEQLAFNITRAAEADDRWVISLKNADKEVDDAIVQQIGTEIAQHNREQK